MKSTSIALILFALLGFMILPGAGAPVKAALSESDSGLDFTDRVQAGSPRLQALLDFRTQQVRDDGSGGLQMRRLAGEKAPASLNAVLIMCDFSDSLMLGRHGQVAGDFPEPMQWDMYYDAHDSIYFDHLLGDVADYYTDVSGGLFQFHYTIYPRVVNLPRPMAFYGNHPDEGEQPLLLAAAVVDSLDEEVDFSLYDTVMLVHVRGRRRDGHPGGLTRADLHHLSGSRRFRRRRGGQPAGAGLSARGGLPRGPGYRPGSDPARDRVPGQDRWLCRAVQQAWECTVSRWVCGWGCSP